VVVGLLLALSAAGSWWLVRAWPGPPRTVRLATGPPGSAHAEYGERYRDILARSGVTVVLEPTAGALSNLARLQDPGSGVGAGFVQVGTTTPDRSPDLVSLGTLFHEPLWLFHRGPAASLGFGDLRGKRIAIGGEGSATRALALRVFALGGIDASAAELLAFSPEEAADRLVRAELDAAVFLTSWSAPVVQRLLQAEGITLASFPRTDAVVARIPVLDKRVLPAGTADLARDIPPADVALVASKASLAVRRDLHPALKYLLLSAASEIHAAPGIFHRAGEFPALEAVDLPLADEAEMFHRRGPPFLQRYLPFRLAMLTERVALVLVPVLGLLLPLMQVLPAARTWYVQRRLALFYGELKLLDLELQDPGARGAAPVLVRQLDELEARVSRQRVPEEFSPLLYGLRHHIRLVRERLVPGPER
jgi:TRAP-type uncharacterized transport system substrate-binding protein